MCAASKAAKLSSRWSESSIYTSSMHPIKLLHDDYFRHRFGALWSPQSQTMCTHHLMTIPARPIIRTTHGMPVFMPVPNPMPMPNKPWPTVIGPLGPAHWAWPALIIIPISSKYMHKAHISNVSKRI